MGGWYGHTTARERLPCRRVCCSFNYNDRCCRKVPSRFLNAGGARSTGKPARRTGHSPVGAAELPKNFFGCVLSEARPGLGDPRGGAWSAPWAEPLQPSQPSSRSMWSVASPPVLAGTRRQPRPGAGEMPACPPRSPSLLQLSLDRILRTSAHPAVLPTSRLRFAAPGKPRGGRGRGGLASPGSPGAEPPLPPPRPGIRLLPPAPRVPPPLRAGLNI